MNKETVKSLIKSYEELTRLYRQAADQACTEGSTFEVYVNVKDSMTCESKVRQLQNRYSHILQGK